MIALLDANLLIALFDAAHLHHQRAHLWFSQNRPSGWATCPLTENACIRIISQPAYPGRLAIADISRRLEKATSATDHHFWPDAVSLCDPTLFDHSRMLTPRHLTDHYLLAMAVANQGTCATFDQGIQLSAVRNATSHHLTMI